MAKLTNKSVLEILGKTPDKVAAELSGFSQTARLLSSEHLHLMEEHPQQWVGLCDGGVKVFGKTLRSVISQVQAKGYPKEAVIVRFIDKDEKTLIL